jgi:hypothetical protein
MTTSLRSSTTSVFLTLASGLLLALTACRKPAPIDVYDGFESPTLSSLWETSRFTSGSVQMQSTIVRAGHGAASITVHPRDTFEAGQHGNADSERDELLEARKLTSREDIPYQFSWSMYLPSDFPTVPVRLVVAQWKQYCGSDSAPCSDDSPVLAVRYIAGVLLITQDIEHHHIVLYQQKRDLRGRWLDLRFPPRSTGRISAWLDNQQVVDYTGVTANPETTATGYASPSYFYFKMGLYRNVMPQPMTAYLDEYRKRQLPTGAF